MSAKCVCLICPKCGNHEDPKCEHDPKHHEGRKRIRPFCADESSHCLECDGWFDLDEIKEPVTIYKVELK